MIERLKGLVRRMDVPRFFCVARWRCLRCDSPWIATRNENRAWEMLREHLAGCEG